MQSRFPLIIFPYDTSNQLHAAEELSQCFDYSANHLASDWNFSNDLKNACYVLEILRPPDRIDLYSKFRYPDTGFEIVVQRKRHYDFLPLFLRNLCQRNLLHYRQSGAKKS